MKKYIIVNLELNEVAIRELYDSYEEAAEDLVNFDLQDCLVLGLEVSES